MGIRTVPRRTGSGMAAVAAVFAVMTGLVVGPPAHAAPSAQSVVDLTVSAPEIDQRSAAGHLIDGPRDLHVRVVLPAGYAEHPTTRYPVLYLLHGATKDYTLYTDEFGLPSLAQLTAARPTIVVTPDAGTHGMYLNWRDGSADWTDLHFQKIVPLIEQKFRVMAGRQWHAVAGISMGGQGTLRYAALLPSYFGSALALSPGFPDTQDKLYAAQFGPTLTGQTGAPTTYEDAYGPIDGAYATASNPSNLVANLRYTRLYISAGDGTRCPGDPVTAETPLSTYIETLVRLQVPPFVEKARRAGVAVTDHLTCGAHEDPVWLREFAGIPSRFPLFAAVPANPTSWTYTTGLDHGQAWQFAFSTSTPPTTALSFTRAGRTLSGTGSGIVTFTAPGCRFSVSLPFSRTLPSGCP